MFFAFVERVTRSTASVRDPPDARKYVCDLQIYRAAYRNRTDDLRITRDTVPRCGRTGCTDSTANRTDGTRRAGIISRPVPRTVPRPRSSSNTRDDPYQRASPARIWPADPVTKAPRPVSVTTARCPAGSAVVAQTRRCATPSRPCRARREAPERLAGGQFCERRRSPSGAGVKACTILAFPAARQAETNAADLPLSSPCSILARWLGIAPDLARTG